MGKPPRRAILRPPEGTRTLTEFSFFARAIELSVAEIVALTGAEPSEGADLSRRLTGIAPVDQASASDLSFVSDAKFADALKSTAAGAVLTTERFASHAPKGVAVLRVGKPYDAFVVVARKLYQSALRPASMFGSTGIATQAAVHASAELEDGVIVDPFAVIFINAR